MATSAQSAGVVINEIDLTTIIPSVATNIAAIAGNFAWGPIGLIFDIQNENKLVNKFGKPDNNSEASFFTSANFLQYGNRLKVVRAANAITTLAATTGGTGLAMPNHVYYEDYYSQGQSNVALYGAWAAVWAGEPGNTLKVAMYADANTANFAAWAYKNNFDSCTGTSDWAINNKGANDEIHIVVIDENGFFTGKANTVLEKYSHLSVASDARSDTGDTKYYPDYINAHSPYIRWLNHPAATWGNVALNRTFSRFVAANSLSGGIATAVSDADMSLAYDKFADEGLDISMMLMGNASPTVISHALDIAEIRKDCMVFFSPPKSNVFNQYGQEAQNMVNYRAGMTSSNKGFMDGNWKYQFDKYRNRYVWVPYNGDTAGLTVRTDAERDPWFSPAGFNRGRILGAIKSAWNPGQADRDTIYAAGINPIVTFAGEGTILYGDKTFQTKPSAFDRINVRRLFFVLEKAIAKASKYSLFELNDEFTRAQFVSMVEPYLRDIQGRRGIYDFRVVCDETNNTPEVIDSNQFIGDIYIKPARSINFIQLNFVAVRTGVAFEEIVGRF